MERRSVTKSPKGKKAYVERKLGECFQWKARGNVQKETHVVSVMTNKYEETCTVVRNEKGLTKEEKILKNIRQTERKILQTQGEKFLAEIKNCKNPSRNVGIPPVCKKLQV